MSAVENILAEEKKTKKNVNWSHKLPIYLKLNLLFSIIALVGLIMGIVAAVIINMGNPVGDQAGNMNILITSSVFLGVGYLFGLIYSSCLYLLYPQSAKLISLLFVHYILNFIPVAHCISWITALIILRRHEYELV